MPELRTAATDGPLQLRCLEVFGGNRAERQELSVPGMDVLVHAQPHEGADSGGDLHYVSTCLKGAISRFMVADVAGHGESVGDLALSLRKLLRKNINTPDQTRLTRQLNEEFSGISSAGKFATAVIGTYYGPTHSMILSNAGHPPPLWYSAAKGTWNLLTHDLAESDSSIRPKDLDNLPLGIIEPTEYRQFAVQIGLDDLIVFYTDSLIEAADANGRQLGPEGLIELARSLEMIEPADVCDTLLERVAAFRDASEADDDVTLLVLRHNAGTPASKSVGEWADALGRLITGR